MALGLLSAVVHTTPHASRLSYIEMNKTEFFIELVKFGGRIPFSTPGPLEKAVASKWPVLRCTRNVRAGRSSAPFCCLRGAFNSPLGLCDNTTVSPAWRRLCARGSHPYNCCSARRAQLPTDGPTVSTVFFCALQLPFSRGHEKQRIRFHVGILPFVRLFSSLLLLLLLTH